LGLSISKHIVKAHEGSIWVNSKIGHGSTFGFSLPIAQRH
jgi:signal transduction histidine kinase